MVPDQRALLIFDNIKGQCTEALLKLLDKNNVSVVLIPPNCTDRLQPLDVSVNKVPRNFFEESFMYGMLKISVLNWKGSSRNIKLI